MTIKSFEEQAKMYFEIATTFRTEGRLLYLNNEYNPNEENPSGQLLKTHFIKFLQDPLWHPKISEMINKSGIIQEIENFNLLKKNKYHGGF